MFTLTRLMIKQIETAIDLIINESGRGEVVLPVVHGRLLDYLERRPIIHMTMPRVNDAGPPRPMTIVES